MYQIGMRSFRAFAGEEKPTWILNYSWDGAKNVQPRDAMLMLAMSELMAGANVWDARGHVMSGSNDMPTRVQIFHWIGQHEDIFGALRKPVGATGVYFSDETRNFCPEEFVASYRGVLLLLLQNHVQFQIVTPRTLAQFQGKVLVLPDVRVLSDDEAATLQRKSDTGMQLVLTGSSDSKLDSVKSAVRFPSRPEVDYLTTAQKDFAALDPSSGGKLLQAIKTDSDVRVLASKNVVAHEAVIDKRTYLFLANFDGLKAGEMETPTTQRDVRVIAPVRMGRTLHVLPFMGTETLVEGKASPNGDGVEFRIPELERGAVAWF
jgi:hypothetical protein